MLNYFINSNNTVTCSVCKKHHKYTSSSSLKNIIYLHFYCDEYFDLYVEFYPRTKRIKFMQVSFDDYLSIDCMDYGEAYYVISFICSEISDLKSIVFKDNLSVTDINNIIWMLLREAKKSIYEYYLG